jgi:hypothetical protein
MSAVTDRHYVFQDNINALIHNYEQSLQNLVEINGDEEKLGKIAELSNDAQQYTLDVTSASSSIEQSDVESRMNSILDRYLELTASFETAKKALSELKEPIEIKNRYIEIKDGAGKPVLDYLWTISYDPKRLESQTKSFNDYLEAKNITDKISKLDGAIDTTSKKIEALKPVLNQACEAMANFGKPAPSKIMHLVNTATSYVLPASVVAQSQTVDQFLSKALTAYLAIKGMK